MNLSAEKKKVGPGALLSRTYPDRQRVGTVAEISLVWNKLVMHVLPQRPLILLGECWPRTIECLSQHLVISDEDKSHLLFADTAERTVALLNEFTF